MIKSSLTGTFQFLEKTLDSGISNFPTNFNWIKQSSPCFSLHGDKVIILNRPQEFYHALLEGCSRAKFRISLASLYIGTGSLEKELIEVINNRMNENAELNVNILLDANRGSRGKINSRKMLLPLLHNNSQCQVSMFHTPSLRGPLKYILPARYNELVGLQHMKLYLFDNNVLLSGANLSEDYFTKRQDRYMLVKDCKELADFYWDLVSRISSVSLGLDHSDSLFPRSYHPYKLSQKTYVKAAKDKIWGFYNYTIRNGTSVEQANSGHDTWVFPLLELPPLSIHQDSKVTQRLLEESECGSTLTLSTGYFNLTDQYVDTILQKTKAKFRILMAHPTANGFLKAGGLASGIPGAYTGLALAFLSRVKSTGQDERVNMFEYLRTGWTYHAKGLWYTLPNCQLPCLTIIGSSNFGSRSVRRDLEAQIVVITTNKSLSQRLRNEEDSLMKYTVKFTPEVGSEPDRRPAFWLDNQNTNDHQIIKEHLQQRICDNPIIIKCSSKECPQTSYIIPNLSHGNNRLINIDSLDQSMDHMQEQLMESRKRPEEQEGYNNNNKHISNNYYNNVDDPVLDDPFSFFPQEENRNSRSTSSDSTSSNDDNNRKARERRNRMFEGLLKFTTILNRVDSFFTEKAKNLIRGLNKMVESEETDEFH